MNKKTTASPEGKEGTQYPELLQYLPKMSSFVFLIKIY